MKTLKRLLLFTTCICFLTTCSKDNDFLGGGQNDLNYNAEKYCKPYHGLDQDRYVIMKSTGLRVHYRIIGKGPTDMVFIPGWTNPLGIYTKQFDFFRYKARCIYIDVPGQGLSDAPEGIDYTLGLMADAIYDIVKKEGVKRFVGVGFSMGPALLGQFELKHPGMIKKLVNLDGSFMAWPPVGPDRDALIDYFKAFCTSMLSWTYNDKKDMLLSLVPVTAPDDLKEFTKYFYDFPNWLAANIFWNAISPEVNEPIGWSMPFLSIYSEEPADMNFEQLCFPNAEIHVMEGSGHVVQWERSEKVNQLIWEFVSDRPGRRY